MTNLKNLLQETPEIDNWMIEKLTEYDIKIPNIEGYSIKDNQITALFERRVSNVNIENWNDDEISTFLDSEIKFYWELKAKLSCILMAPLYLIIWKNGIERFRIIKIEYDSKLEASTIELFENCSDLALWLASLKGINVSKGFVESGRLSFIDKCLRTHGVPWPGNLDGFIMNKEDTKISAIFEISRTRKFPVKTHDLNNYFTYDKNRWSVFETIKKSLNCNAFIIIWSSNEKIIKLMKLKEINSSGLVYDYEIIINKEDIVSKISEMMS